MWLEGSQRQKEGSGVQSGRVEHTRLCLTHSLRRWSLCLAQGAAEAQERRVRAGVFTLPLSCIGKGYRGSVGQAVATCEGDSGPEWGHHGGATYSRTRDER